MFGMVDGRRDLIIDEKPLPPLTELQRLSLLNKMEEKKMWLRVHEPRENLLQFVSESIHTSYQELRVSMRTDQQIYEGRVPTINRMNELDDEQKYAGLFRCCQREAVSVFRKLRPEFQE